MTPPHDPTKAGTGAANEDRRTRKDALDSRTSSAEPGTRPRAAWLWSPSVVGALAAALVLAVGVFLLNFNTKPGRLLTRASYDELFDLVSAAPAGVEQSDVVIVYLDEKSHRDLRQPFTQPWDRALHAELLDRLTADGARAVVFDILFTDAGPDPAADAALARAIRANGRVVLAAEYQPARQLLANSEVLTTWTLNLPYEPFLEAGARWGLALLQPDSDFVVRQHYHGPPEHEYPSLAWATAQLLELPLTREAGGRLRERWMNYYTRRDRIPQVSYSDVRGLRPGFFRHKIVFVGARPIASSFIERRDEFRTPFLTWDDTYRFMPAVEVQATVFLNLLRRDWLERFSPAGEFAVLWFTACVFGFGLCRLRPSASVGAAVGALGGVVLLAVLVFTCARLWFPWMIVAVGQIPAALLAAAMYRAALWFGEERKLKEARRRAELQIREQAALLDKASDAISVLDLEGRLLFWNQGAERVYGWTAAEALGKRADDLLCAAAQVQNGNEKAAAAGLHPSRLAVASPAELPAMRQAQQVVLQEGEWSGELRHRTKAGKPVVMASRWSLVRDDQGRPKSILVIGTDVTERKQLEAQFLRAQRLESIGTLAGGIAHDLNNVLTPIIMASDLLKLKRPDEATLKLLQTIEASAKRGAGMVKQVLTFARGHEGERCLMSLTPLVKEMVKIAGETFPKSIRVRARLADGLWAVSGDATQLHQVLLNLCVNARDAMPDGGEILLAAENHEVTPAQARAHLDARPGKYVRLSVTDTGTGIPPEVMDRMFEPFFTTKQVGRGTGLGLATVLSIVKSHQGFLDVQSQVGKGTTFSIHLPAMEVAQTEASPPKEPGVVESRAETVLVVDDEASIRQMLQASLGARGWRVLTAGNGAEAISVCSQHADELGAVILDMMMPVMDGPTALPLLRKLKPDLRFVLISGLLQADALREQLGDANVTFLQKPFSMDKLEEALRGPVVASAPPPAAVCPS